VGGLRPAHGGLPDSAVRQARRAPSRPSEPLMTASMG